MRNLKSLEDIHGLVAPVVTPSGRRFVIRQQNGNDDDIISNMEDTSKGKAMAKFLAAIIVDSDFTPVGTLTYEDVTRLRLNDIYYLMLASRIFSLGKILKFQYKWDDVPELVEYEEDLENFIWDYDTEFPGEDHEYYNEFRLKPISKDFERIIPLSSGKTIKYTFMNLRAETFLLKLPASEKSKNSELLARELTLIKEDGSHVKVENFRFFTPRDMMEIRKDVEDNDVSPEVYSEIIHPDGKTRILYPVMATIDFFFPREIL